VIADLGLPAARIAMVGDDIRSDVQAAMTVGMRGVLVRTGKFRDADLEQGIEPDLVLGSVNDVLNG
jgi:ribonucleotide monophosphatase NagD (HAD superfamily)